MIVANIKSERKGKPETLILDGDEVCGTCLCRITTHLLFPSFLIFYVLGF